MGLYWHLNLLGYPVEIILGDTVFEGSGKPYDATSKSLWNEFKKGASSEILKFMAGFKLVKIQLSIMGYQKPVRPPNLGAIGRQIGSEYCVFHKAEILKSIGLRYMPMMLKKQL